MFTYISIQKRSSNQFSLELRDLKGLPGNGVLSSVRSESISDPKLRKSYHDADILEMKSDLAKTKLPATEHLLAKLSLV